MTLIQIEWLCRSKEEAQLVLKELFERKLIACANMSCVDSLYIWQGALESSSEVKVVMKTLEKHFKIITQEIKRLGSYEVPCVLGTYVDIANSEYSEWIAQSIAVFKNT